jgi:hypothetical protein
MPERSAQGGSHVNASGEKDRSIRSGHSSRFGREREEKRKGVSTRLRLEGAHGAGGYLAGLG